MQRSRESEDSVPCCGGECVKDNGDCACAEAVGHVCCEENDEECDEIGRCAEGLRGERGVAHFSHDFGQEDGEGGVGHVCEEEHGCCDPGYGVAEDGEGFADLQA